MAKSDRIETPDNRLIYNFETGTFTALIKPPSERLVFPSIEELAMSIPMEVQGTPLDAEQPANRV
jgi:hypothetical protein